MQPIGVFDSGIGGLSILKALRAELSSEDFIYVADSGHAPYGERDPLHVIERARTITRYLRDQHKIKALVIACNTATAAAIHLLRQEEPDLPIIGVEPALKPATLHSQTRRIGVMATQGTLSSAKFQTLLNSLEDQAEFICLPCNGLANAIEIGDIEKIQSLSRHYTAAIGPFADQYGGGVKNKVDTLVLGCTHYPFARDLLQNLVGLGVTLLDSGTPVARQTRRVLEAQATLAPARQSNILLCSTGDFKSLEVATHRWLKLETTVSSIFI